MLRQSQYLKESDNIIQASWPTIICDKTGSLLLAYFHSDNEYSESIKFYDLKEEREIVQVDGVSVFLC